MEVGVDQARQQDRALAVDPLRADRTDADQSVVDDDGARRGQRVAVEDADPILPAVLCAFAWAGVVAASGDTPATVAA